MDDGSGATLREVVAGRDAVLSGNYQWQSGGAGNGLVEVTAVSGSSEGKAFVLVVDGTQWVITPQPAVVGQDDVLAMSATQDGVTGMGAWMTKADFDLLWEIFSMTLAQSDTVTARQMLSAMFDEPNLTPPPLVAQLVTEGLPLLRVTVTDWDWMAAVEELIINGQTVDTSGWYPEDWEELLTQPHVQEMVLVLTENQEVVVERTIRAVMSDTGAEWHGVNTGSVDVVFFPMQEIAEVSASVSSTLTHHNESGIRGSCDSYPEWTLAEATLWVVNVGRVVAKDWQTGQTAETVRDLETNEAGVVGELITGVGGFVSLQAFINPTEAPMWPSNKPGWKVLRPEENADWETLAEGTPLTQFDGLYEEGEHKIAAFSSPELWVAIRAVRLGLLTLDSNNDRQINEQDEVAGVKLTAPGFVFWVKHGGASRPWMEEAYDLEDFARIRIRVAPLGRGYRYQLRWSPDNENQPNSNFGISVYPMAHENYLTVKPNSNNSNDQLKRAKTWRSELDNLYKNVSPNLRCVVTPSRAFTFPVSEFTPMPQDANSQELERWFLIAGIQAGDGLMELVQLDAAGNTHVLDAVYLTIRRLQDLYVIGNARDSMADDVDLLRFKNTRSTHMTPGPPLNQKPTYNRVREQVPGWIENSPTTAWGNQHLDKHSDYKYPNNPYVRSTRFIEVRELTSGQNMANMTLDHQFFASRNPALLQPNGGIELRNPRVAVAIHGFNIKGNYVKWFDAMYKRLYWAGWDGAFMGITWDGDAHKKATAPNDQEPGESDKISTALNGITGNLNYFNFDVENALRSGQAVADVLHRLKVSGCGTVNVITHSLGAVVAGQAMFDLGTRATREKNFNGPWLHRVVHMQAAQGYDHYAPVGNGAEDWDIVTAPDFFRTRSAEGDSLRRLRNQPWKGIFQVAVNPQSQVVAENGIINTFSDTDSVLGQWFSFNEGHGGPWWTLWGGFGLSTVITKNISQVWPQALFRKYSVHRELVWESLQKNAMGLGGTGTPKVIPGLPAPGDNPETNRNVSVKQMRVEFDDDQSDVVNVIDDHNDWYKEFYHTRLLWEFMRRRLNE